MPCNLEYKKVEKYCRTDFDLLFLFGHIDCQTNTSKERNLAFTFFSIVSTHDRLKLK